jgi:DNA modification methylase
MTIRILHGDCREVLKTLADESAHCIVTSPPYYGLRDYGVEGQMGMECTPGEYIDGMVAVFREVRRVLRDDGTLWLNMGDSYAGGGNGGGGSFAKDGIRCALPGADKNKSTRFGKRGAGNGIKPKDLIGVPWMLAFALRADGWYLRQDIIWSKPNPMPESVRDRCTKAHEYLFLLSKSPRYYFDADAIAEPIALTTVERLNQPNLVNQGGSDRVPGKTNGAMKAVAPASHKGSRFDQGKTAKHQMDRAQQGPRFGGSKYGDDCSEQSRTKSGHVYTGAETRNKRSVWTIATQPFKEAHFATFPPSLIEPCILAGCPQGGTVLDPFGGAGTTGLVADRLQRNAMLIELNAEYIEIARRRISGDAPLLTEVA